MDLTRQVTEFSESPDIDVAHVIAGCRDSVALNGPGRDVDLRETFSRCHARRSGYRLVEGHRVVAHAPSRSTAGSNFKGNAFAGKVCPKAGELIHGDFGTVVE